MPTQQHEAELLSRLETLVRNHPRNLTIRLGDDGGVVIERRGHVRGIWRCMDGAFAWTPAGYNEPVHQASELVAAVAYTQPQILV
jgi:hypothetical protein